MNKAFIFAAGFVLGGVIGTTLTVFAYQKEKKQKEEDKKLLDGKNGAIVHYSDGSLQVVTEDVKNAITTSPEELRSYYISQLRDLGFEVIDTEEEDYDNSFYDEDHSSSVNPVEEEEDEEEGDNCYPIDPNPEPYEIVEREFGDKEFYDSESLIWYRGDGTMCSEDDLEMIDDWQQHIGYVEGRLNGCRGNQLYFRNEVEQTDYEVRINHDSYKHAVEGEEDDE